MKQTRKKLRQALSLIVIACMVILLIPTTNAKAMTQGEAVVEEARKHLGKPYVWGATGPNSFDCSGLTQYSYRQALGIEIGRTTYDQIKSGMEVSRSELQPGDLVFTSADHVQIYAGNGMIIHAPHSGDVVKEVPLYSFWRARRIVESTKNGWAWEDGKSYFYKDGVRQKGWVYVNDKWYYQDENDGHSLYGWLEINGNRYFLDPTYGFMWTGWQTIGGNRYYFNTTYGHAEKGWINFGDTWYFMNEKDGNMEKGWIYTNGHSYYMNTEDGHMEKGWVYVNNKWYYQDTTYGHSVLGWLEVNGNKYFLDSTYGFMWTGWQKIDGKWYYFNTTYGHAERNTKVDGYTLDNEGVAIDRFD